MKKTLNKIIKGTLAVFAIKFIIIAIAFTFQSCQTEADDSEFNNKESDDFKTSLKLTSNTLNSISFEKNISYDGYLRGSIQPQTANYCIQLINPLETITEEIDNLSDLIKAKTNPNILVFNHTNENSDSESDVEYDPNDCISIVQIPTDQVSDALEPAVIEAKRYLETKGFSSSEIQRMIDDEQGVKTDLIPLVMTMISVEDSSNNLVNNYSFSNMFFNSAHAQSGRDIGRCALAAVGADIIWSLGSDPGKWTKKAVKKAFGAIAKRLLGPVGAAIAVVTFGLCVADAALTIKDA